MERGDEIQMRFRDGVHSGRDLTLAPRIYGWGWALVEEPRKALIVADSDSD